jgi:hypothetical protein
MKQTNGQQEWQHARAEIFWGEIAPCDHVLQIYENDDVFLDALAGFVGAGINAGECCIVIATDVHLAALELKLTNLGIHIQDLIDDRRYLPVNADATLARFMVNGWPHEELFYETVTSLIGKCNPKKRVRAFGEMVAMLWAKGYSGATVQLEHLWNKVCEEKTLGLFCAYPKAGFTTDINDSLMQICCSHSRMISGSERQMVNVSYRSTPAAPLHVKTPLPAADAS